MDNGLEAKRIYRQLRPLLVFQGDKDAVRELTDLVCMITSVPAGQQILRGVIAQGKPVPLSFSSRPGLTGRFHVKDNSIEIPHVATNVLEMSKKARMRSKILMTRILAHEFQHCADNLKTRWLDYHAMDVDTAVLADVLCEMNAYMNEDQVAGELRSQQGVLDKIIVRGIELIECVRPKSPQERKEVMRLALSGKIPRIKGYINKTRKRVSQRPFRKADFTAKAVYRANVEAYLQEMQIDMSYEEAIRLVRESIKLLPAARLKSSDYSQ